MINISLHIVIFPDVLKAARVFPIHKGGPSEDPWNYRPISILPVVSKVTEKHVTKHVFAYLNKYKLLHEAQSGFRKHHSCQTALIKLINDWLSHIDTGNIVGSIFFDLKAFDVVDHEMLLQKLALFAGLNHTFQTDLSVSWMGWKCQVASQSKAVCQRLRAGTGSVPYIYKRHAISVANGHRYTLMILLPILPVKNWTWLNLSYKSVQMTSIHGASM